MTIRTPGLSPLVLALLAACSTGRAAPVETSRSGLPPADTTHGFWPGAQADSAAMALGVKPLRQSLANDGVEEIRIWVGGGIGAETDFLALSRRGGKVDGAAGRYWRMGTVDIRRPEIPTIDSIVRNSLRGECDPFVHAGRVEACRYNYLQRPDWRLLWDSLARANVWALPDQKTLPNDSMLIFDGVLVVVELRDGAYYRTYLYNNPYGRPGPQNHDAAAIERIWQLLPARTAGSNWISLRGRLEIGWMESQLYECGSNARWHMVGISTPAFRIIHDSIPKNDSTTHLLRVATVTGLRALPGMTPSGYAGQLEAVEVKDMGPWSDAACREGKH